jgi:hypothetical protein
MKTTAKPNKTAGLNGQMLPGTQPVSVPPLPRIAEEGRQPGCGQRPLDLLARIHDIIAREVRMFKHAADDLVEVALTPDAKTQISLRLQWRNGVVVARARCDFGDYRSLKTQWPQLQLLLARQGVRLSPLGERAPSGFTDFFNHPDLEATRDGAGRPGSVRDESKSARAAPATPPASVSTFGPLAFRRWLAFWT